MVREILKLKSSWEFLQETELPVILYGTGNGADKIIDELERLGVKLYGVTASDGFVRKRQFRGFEVKALSDFESELEDFVVIIGFGTQRQEVIDNIISISKRHKVLVPCVPVYGDSIINRDFLKKNLLNIKAVYYELADEKSQEVYKDFLRFEFTGELEYLLRSETEKDEAFKDILQLTSAESYLDLGAYRGDTVAEFLHYTGGCYDSITAVEPDRKSFEKLQDFAKDFDFCKLLNKGIWSEEKVLEFGSALGRGNSISKGGESIEAVSVDSLCADSEFTYIKADIEGCEGEMLKGAQNTLEKLKPKLNIAAYHRSEDFFDIPLTIRQLNPEYKIYLRHHRYIPCWDMNFYCV